LGAFSQNYVFISLPAFNSLFGNNYRLYFETPPKNNICLFAYLLIVVYLLLSSLGRTPGTPLVGFELLLVIELEIISRRAGVKASFRKKNKQKSQTQYYQKESADGPTARVGEKSVKRIVLKIFGL
jgi:hypothetical protein